MKIALGVSGESRYKVEALYGRVSAAGAPQPKSRAERGTYRYKLDELA